MSWLSKKLLVVGGLIALITLATTSCGSLRPEPTASASSPSEPILLLKTIPSATGLETNLVVKDKNLVVKDNPFDIIFDKLREAQIAFKAPERMGYGETEQVRLLLSETMSAPELEHILQDTNNVRTNSVKVADVMEAHLVGDDFDILPITPETQPISRRETTEWKWDIKPKDFGSLPLHLSLNANVTINGQERTRSIKTFDETIYVQVTGYRSVMIFVRSNWQWLWTTIIVPIAIWLWHRKRKAKKKKKQK